jgi:hypothetical protein
MQNIITLELLTAVSDTGFSLDELVHVLRQVSQEKGLPGLAVMVLRLVDEMLLLRHLRGQGWSGQPCCQQPAYESLGFQPREIRTSIGLLEFSWRRYRCTACGKTRVPLRDFLGLERYQSQTGELEQIVVEVVTEQSYRRSSQHLKTIGGIPVPKSTAHRWLVETDSDQLDAPAEKLSSLLADGTGYKRRPDAKAALDNKGQLRMAVGIAPSGKATVLGTWSGQSWQEIATQLNKGSPRQQKVADLLVSDGEPGLAEALGSLTGDQQRCLWHLTHDLNDPMWRDGASKKERRATQKELAAMVRIEMPPEDGEPVRPEDRDRVEQQMEQAERGVTDLVRRLTLQGYDRAATYVHQAQSRLFGYLRFWLKHGVVNPKVSSFIERLMREVARRLKRIAFGWRPENAAKMARIVLKRVTDPLAWEAYWTKRLRLEGNVTIAFRGVKASPQTLGR